MLCSQVETPVNGRNFSEFTQSSFMNSNIKKNAAFTLMEMSIVLVIIGLVIGGVITGIEMVENAKINRQVTQIRQISEATSAFVLKYNSLPGDLANPDEYGITATKPGQIHSNGKIDDLNQAVYVRETGGEPTIFFQHLEGAKMLSQFLMPGNSNAGTCYGVTTGYPLALSINSKFGMIAATIRDRNYLFLGITNCASGILWIGSMSPNGFGAVNGVMTPLQAQRIDKKIDDGIPGSGRTTATVLSASNTDIDGTLDATANRCVTDNTSTKYNITNNSNWCRLLVPLQ